MAEPAPASDPGSERKNLLDELAEFAEDEAAVLERLADRVRSLSAPQPDEEFDVEAIWATVERRIDLGSDPDQTREGRSENG